MLDRPRSGQPMALDYAASRPRPARATLEAIATASAFFGAAATAGGTLCAAGLEYAAATLLAYDDPARRTFCHALAAGLLVVAAVGVLSTVSACCMTIARHRRLSLWVAAVQLVVIPIGTALGLATIVLLLRPSCQAAYDRRLGSG